MARPYQILDVFTSTALAGNPLAVVAEADGLSSELMQAIAGEFNLSETVFLSAPSAADDTADMRIFTPRSEMPFAGHPTVGTAVALALRTGRNEIRLAMPAGRVICSVTQGAVRRAAFDAPRLPEAAPLAMPIEALAALCSLTPDDIAFEDYRPALISSGPAFNAVPLRDVAALGRARYAAQHAGDLGATKGLYLFARTGERAFQARMYAPLEGIEEDPATGSVAVAFCAMYAAAERPGDGVHRLTVAQGIEMGRPSEIALEVEVASGSVRRVRLSGEAVLVAEGKLFA